MAFEFCQLESSVCPLFLIEILHPNASFNVSYICNLDYYFVCTRGLCFCFSGVNSNFGPPYKKIIRALLLPNNIGVSRTFYGSKN